MRQSNFYIPEKRFCLHFDFRESELQYHNFFLLAKISISYLQLHVLRAQAQFYAFASKHDTMSNFIGTRNAAKSENEQKLAQS